MAKSKFYHDQYKLYKSEASGYDKNLKSLIKIRDSLMNDFSDEQGKVNRELNDLKDDLTKAVRHDPNFNSIANSCESYMERTTTADANLNNTVIALENEINNLNSKKSTAEQNMNTQYQNYNNAKEAERQEFLNSLKNAF